MWASATIIIVIVGVVTIHSSKNLGDSLRSFIVVIIIWWSSNVSVVSATLTRVVGKEGGWFEGRAFIT